MFVYVCVCMCVCAVLDMVDSPAGGFLDLVGGMG